MEYADAFFHEKVFYFVLEYVDGGNLADFIQEKFEHQAVDVPADPDSRLYDSCRGD